MKPMRRAPRPKAEAIRMKMRTGKYSDGKYVPGISGYVILKRLDTCQAKKFDNREPSVIRWNFVAAGFSLR